jgi:hypothetical protein
MLMSLDNADAAWPIGSVEVLHASFGMELRGKPV